MVASLSGCGSSPLEAACAEWEHAYTTPGSARDQFDWFRTATAVAAKAADQDPALAPVAEDIAAYTEIKRYELDEVDLFRFHEEGKVLAARISGASGLESEPLGDEFESVSDSL